MTDHDVTPGDDTPSRPPVRRSFTTPELEAVIRRAVELQSGHASRVDDGVSEGDVVRIGQELGLDPAAVRRAMAEVGGRAPERRSALDGFVGPGGVRASRVIRRPAAEVTSSLERHLREVELMVPQRRFPERTRYVRDPSFAAGISRFVQGFSRRQRPLDLTRVDVTVSPLDDHSCLVDLAIDQSDVRVGLAAGVVGSSGVAAATWGTVVLATPIIDPLALAGLPLVAGAWAGMRAIYRNVSRSNEDKLESLLDRLEHGEIG